MHLLRASAAILSAFLVSSAAAQSCADLGGTGAVVRDNAGTSYQLGCKHDLYQIADLGGVQTSTFKDCINTCETNAQCKAVSYENGWCWLKFIPTDPTVRPSVSNDVDMAWVQGSFDRSCSQFGGTGTIVSDDAGNKYQLDCMQDLYQIGDLGGVQISSFSGCLDACRTNTQCKAVSYGYGWCWLKSLPTDPNAKPTPSQNIDTAWIQGSFAQSGGQGQVTCAQGSILTTTDGSQFALCPQMDWQGTSIYALSGFTSNQNCAEACSLTPLCKLAVFDATASVCHMKANQSQLTSASNTRFNQINLIKKGSPSVQSNAVGGKWSSVINLPVVAGAAYVVPAQPTSNRVLVFSANSEKSFGSRTGLTKFADYNYINGATSEMSISNTQHDMFCPGISSLADGKVVITGGADASRVSIYDPTSNSFTAGPQMQIARGYQASTVLSNGKIFTIGGSWNGGTHTKNGEVYDPSANTWTLLNGADASYMATQDSSAHRRDNHAWLHAWSDGTIFQAGPSKQMNWYGTSGAGSVGSAGARNATNDAMCAGNVMYDAGKILAAGGTLVYDDSPSVSTSYVISIGNAGQNAAVEKVADMKYSRAFANVVVLPDGTSVIFGGQKRSRQFTDIESTVYPELFNPTSKTWKVMNPQAIPRNYHSSAVLLGDGTVFSAGGGLCYVTDGNDNDIACDPSADHANAEIWSPPYLFNQDGSLATRPSINSVSTSNDGNGNWVRAGGVLTVKTSQGGMTFSIVRLGSATHSTNTDQRRLSVTATQNNGAWSIKLPSDNGVLLPGYWFLFAMNQAGTPSIARVVQVKL